MVTDNLKTSLMATLLESFAVTVMSLLPTFAMAGVPEKVRVAGVNVSHVGKPLAEYVSESPASTSLNVFAGNINTNAAFAVAIWSGIKLATIGASLVLATVIRKLSVTVALLLSLAVTVTSTMPTFAFVGVPENVRVAGVKVSQLGKALVE